MHSFLYLIIPMHQCFYNAVYPLFCVFLFSTSLLIRKTTSSDIDICRASASFFKSCLSLFDILMIRFDDLFMRVFLSYPIIYLSILCFYCIILNTISVTAPTGETTYPIAVAILKITANKKTIDAAVTNPIYIL